MITDYVRTQNNQVMEIAAMLRTGIQSLMNSLPDAAGKPEGCSAPTTDQLTLCYSTHELKKGQYYLKIKNVPDKYDQLWIGKEANPKTEKANPKTEPKTDQEDQLLPLKCNDLPELEKVLISTLNLFCEPDSNEAGG
jgi:hypothetical protein